MIERHHPDCVILVETKLDERFSNSEFFDLNQWNVIIREDRNIHGGGIIIAVLRKYVATPVNIKYDDKDDNPELYWIKLHAYKNHKPIYICGFYRSQKDIRSSNFLNCLQESMQKLPGKKGQHHVVLLYLVDPSVSSPDFATISFDFILLIKMCGFQENK